MKGVARRVLKSTCCEWWGIGLVGARARGPRIVGEPEGTTRGSPWRLGLGLSEARGGPGNYQVTLASGPGPRGPLPIPRSRCLRRRCRYAAHKWQSSSIGTGVSGEGCPGRGRLGDPALAPPRTPNGYPGGVRGPWTGKGRKKEGGGKEPQRKGGARSWVTHHAPQPLAPRSGSSARSAWPRRARSPSRRTRCTARGRRPIDCA